MVSLIYPDTDPYPCQEVRIPAGGRIVPLDWRAVAEAFEGASAELGWDADFEVHPERRHVWVIVPREPERRSYVAKTTIDFYLAVARRLGMEEFMSVWVDFALKPKLAA